MVTDTVSGIYTNRKISLIHSYNYSIKHFWPFLGINLLIGLIALCIFIIWLIVAGFLFKGFFSKVAFWWTSILIIIIAMIMIRFIFVPAVFVIENNTSKLALKRSAELAKGVKTKITAIEIYLLYFIVGYFPYFFVPKETWKNISQIYNIIVSSAGTPFIQVFFIVLYYKLITKEIELKSSEIVI
ncbi:hypothetical protein CO111_02160 [Candidatus Desantisbacteria bacterium CG_4_9_14_3_um_filter_50_7]|nr:MAG: hypothetical protein CO111_02160 [Candidatus Desantisbacteria bacterium CG_4_9_14_3_um_filter_50_7]